MKTFAHYCQKCRAGNAAGEEFCLKCGTPLMLVVTTVAARHETAWHNSLQAEHLLERISVLEVRLMQVTDKLSDILDLVLRQSKVVQSEHNLIETVMDALTATGIIEKGQINQALREKQERTEKENAAAQNRETACQEVLDFGDNTKIDLFTHLVKEGFKQIGAGDEIQGLKTLERAVAIAPENLPLLAFLGKYYFQIDKRGLSGNYLRRARRLDKSNVVVNLLSAVLSADEGDYDATKNLLENFVDNPKYVFSINYVLGMVYVAQSNHKDALTAFRRILASR
ncbi:MAG: hypothetical protein H7Z37_18350, partial [Pyrinomonadaceae bacterium]|nr:hypothetical protein [Pyrinomonadaceae bacterium]